MEPKCIFRLKDFIEPEIYSFLIIRSQMLYLNLSRFQHKGQDAFASKQKNNYDKDLIKLRVAISDDPITNLRNVRLIRQNNFVILIKFDLIVKN